MLEEPIKIPKRYVVVQKTIAELATFDAKAYDRRPLHIVCWSCYLSLARAQVIKGVSSNYRRDAAACDQLDMDPALPPAVEKASIDA